MLKCLPEVPSSTCINKNCSAEEYIADDDEGKCTKTKSERIYNENQVFEKSKTHFFLQK